MIWSFNILDIRKRNSDMMDQDTANENVSEDSEDDLSTSTKKRKILPNSSEDEDSIDNPAKHGQPPSLIPLDDEEAILNDLLDKNNDNDNDNDNGYIYLQDKDRNLPGGADDGGLEDESMATQETSNSSAVLEDNGVYSSLSPTLIIY